jgi:hypothetical protein
MKLDSSSLSGDREDIISVFIDHITRTVDEEETEEKEGRRRTDIKVFLANTDGFEVGNLNASIEALAETEKLSKHIQRYISEHNFREEALAQDISLVEIDTPKRARTDQFVFFDDDDYLRIITAERRKWTKKTAEKLIKYLPSLERVFLTPGDLEEIVGDLYGASVTGFTAKYHSYKEEKRASIRFHGGTREDLDDVERVFNAKPTRLEFGQRNSPTNAIHSSIAQEGHYSFSSVRPGSEERGAKTLNELSEAFEEHDQQNYDVEHKPVRRFFEGGVTLEGFTTLRLIDEDGEDLTSETADRLEEDILDRKQQYEFSEWERGNYMVFDKDHGEQFEITVEQSDVLVHAKESTTSSSLRDFCSLVFEEFDSTYSLEKTSRKLEA